MSTSDNPELTCIAGNGSSRHYLPSREMLIGAATLLACIVAWQGLSSSGIVSDLILPGPLALVKKAVYLAGPECTPPFQLERDTGFTLARLIGGFLLAAAFAIPIGIAAALSRPVSRLLEPVLAIFMSIPALAFVPILMLLTGIGEMTDFTVVVIAAFVPIAVYVHQGVRLIDKKYFWTASSFGATAGTVFRHVILPASIAPLVGGLRMGMGYAWRSLIATESLTALTGGLGYTAFQSSQFFDTQTIYLYMVVIALLGFTIEFCFRFIETRTVVRWGLLAATGGVK